MTNMNFDKDENEIPYNEYGELLTSGELVVIRINYEYGYTIVVDDKGECWKVTANIEKFTAILTRVVE